MARVRLSQLRRCVHCGCLPDLTEHTFQWGTRYRYWCPCQSSPVPRWNSWSKTLPAARKNWNAANGQRQPPASWFFGGPEVIVAALRRVNKNPDYQKTQLMLQTLIGPA